ncbi:MAG: ShlB/FhaC/HecB family hemolysin secretion/activation protein [Gammaproteobacteria bacterium]|nr:ShlB/FhaC/HecB family hemolysin secretion/activation protein [Gammaproteobacteria bacterium]
MITGLIVTSALHADETAAPKFDVWELQIDGNTLLSTRDVEQTVMPFLGAQRTFENIEEARKALEQRYRDLGYPTVLVDIPEQEANQGVIRLHVSESRVVELRVTGARYFSPQQIRAAVPALAENAVIALPQMQAELTALNGAASDRAITPVLRPGRKPGTVEVELKVKDELPLHGSAELDNRNGAGSSALRASAMLRYDNLWQRQHSLSVQVQTSPDKPDEVRVLSGTYVAHFDNTDNLLAVYAVDSNSSSAAAGDISVLGKGRIGGVRGIVPFVTEADFSHNLSLGFDYKDFKESLHAAGQDNPLSTPIEYVVFGTQYSANWHAETTSTRVGLGMNFGVRGLRDRSVLCEYLTRDDNGNPKVETQALNEFACKRAGARSNFIVLHGEVEHRRLLGYGIGLRALFDTQFADSPLISNEEYSAGGAESVRGYYESQVLGDTGERLTVELSSPSIAPHISEHMQDAHALLFYDAAHLRVREPGTEERDRFDIASVGVGLRATAWHDWSAELDMARAFKAAGTIDKGDVRVHAKIEYTF